jgi:hypothetical protein
MPVVGLPLLPFINEMRRVGAQLRFCGQDLSLAYILPMLQLALNLTGNSADPLSLTWDACKGESMYSSNVTFLPDSPSALFLHYAQLLIAYILNDLDLAEEASKAANYGLLTGTHFSQSFHIFLDALLYISLYREKKKKHYWRTANRLIDKFAELSRRQPINCLGMLVFLQAEELSLKKDKDYVKEAYDDAISHLMQGEFVHLAAIANERAGEFMARRGDLFWAQTYMSRAFTLYDEWGAVVKSNQLLRQHRLEPVRAEPQQCEVPEMACIRPRMRQPLTM